MVYHLLYIFQRYSIIALLFLGVLLPACHKEDPTGYEMPLSVFSAEAVRKNRYQLTLAEEMLSIRNDNNLLILAEKRKYHAEEYIRQLSIAMSKQSITNSLELHEEDKRKILELKTLSGLDHRAKLIGLLMDSDQELIALHVKASSSTGVVDQSIRSWAASQLPLLMENLNEVQRIK
ncbi:hypothetical protein [Pedobacter sp. N23S346]|uniref:hypothetical protein n=1 Tax=Pedobacter sp. N23S346 TaxID=3402750 RepID=UPI003AD48F84